jgi:hypothetical protein
MQWLARAVLGSAALLGGCAAFSPDGGFAAVEKTAQDRLGKEVQRTRSDADQARIDQRVSELLAKPLTVDDAVQVISTSPRPSGYRPAACPTPASPSPA